MTGALHDWPNSNEVYHLKALSGEILGVIKKRYEAHT